MFLVQNKPFVNFDQHIDIKRLLEIKPLISCFIARNPHLIKPSKYRSSNFDNGMKGVFDYQSLYKNNPEKISDPILRNAIIDLIELDLFGNYCIFEHQDAVTSPFSLVTRYCKSFYTKHLSSECVAISEDKQIDFFYDWLDQQNIFKEYGRVSFFINYPGTVTALHKDYPGDTTSNDDEFIWLNIANKNSFYILDKKTSTKIYLTGYCCWFNTGNYHGSESLPYSCYSIRVDGVFNDEFKKRALANNKT